MKFGGIALAVIRRAAVFDVVGEEDVGVCDFAAVVFGTVPFVVGRPCRFLLLPGEIFRDLDGHIFFLACSPPKPVRRIRYRRLCYQERLSANGGVGIVIFGRGWPSP